MSDSMARAELMKRLAARVDAPADHDLLDVYHALLGESLRVLRAMEGTITVQQIAIASEPSRVARQAAVALLLDVAHLLQHHAPHGSCFDSMRESASVLDAALGHPLHALDIPRGNEEMH